LNSQKTLQCYIEFESNMFLINLEIEILTKIDIFQLNVVIKNEEFVTTSMLNSR
jgi:hypothetical protein